MTYSINIKRALLTSVLSLLLCVAMLIGSTFAWFTDSVTSGKNRIAAGNLDVELSYKTGGMTDWRNVESLGSEEVDPFFRNIAGDKIAWEPGVVGVTSFKVENVGTLAFKYALALLAVKYNQMDGRDLRDVIKFAVIDGEPSADFTAEESQKLDYSAFPDFTKRSALLANDGVSDSGRDQEIFTVVAYWKPNDAKTDNLYNVSNGKIATELDGAPSTPNQLYLDMDIRLNAWQDTVESDSFDNQYDATAEALDKFPDGCYTVTEHAGWAELDIYTGRSTADIHISYTGYAPDNTDDRMAAWVTNGSGTVMPAAANGNTHLIFFKAEDSGSFTLTQEGYVLPMLTLKDDGTLAQSRTVYSAAARNAVNIPSAHVDLSAAETVSDEAGMLNVIDALNQSGGERVVKLGGNIDATKEWTLRKGTLTILGEGYSIINYAEGKNFYITGMARLNLGADGYSGGLVLCAGEERALAVMSVGGSAEVNICEGAVIDRTYAGNTAMAGAQSGGIHIAENATVNLLGGAIRNCSSGAAGGGVGMLGSSKFNMYSGEIANCTGAYGGAVGMSVNTIGDAGALSAVFTMYGGTIRDCVSTGALMSYGWDSFLTGGGAVCMPGLTNRHQAKFVMNGGLITGCSVEAGEDSANKEICGGAVYARGATVELNAGEISGNRVAGSKATGGGVALVKGGNNTATLSIADGFRLYNNFASAGGDDIAVSDAKMVKQLGSVDTSCQLACGHAIDGFYSDQNGVRWTEKGQEGYSEGYYVKATASTKYFKAAHGEVPEAECIIQFTDRDTGEVYGEFTIPHGEAIQFPSVTPVRQGYIFTGWVDEYGRPARPTVTKSITYYADFWGLEGVGTPGRLLDLYNGSDNNTAISAGGAKTVTWFLESSHLATQLHASTPIAQNTKITMAYYPDADDRSVVDYYYVIVPSDTTSISLCDFLIMGGSEHFVPQIENGNTVWYPIYQLSFVFPEAQRAGKVWLSDTANDTVNGSAVDIAFTGNSVSTPSGELTVSDNTVTVSGLTGFAADQSDSRHNRVQDLTDRKAVLAVEAVDAQGRTVAIPSKTVVTVCDKQAKVTSGIAALEITDNGDYTITAEELPQDAVGIRVHLCYVDNNIIQKPMANVIRSVTINS